MNKARAGLSGIAVIVALVAVSAGVARAQDEPRRHKPIHHRGTVSAGERPLTIGRNRQAHSGVIQISPYEVYAPGGFPYRGARPTFDERQQLRHEDEMASVRARTNGVYGWGLDGLNGPNLWDDDNEAGYSNPNYGNSYNRYTGYNGIPSDLAFGPTYAFRHITDHDPDEDEDAHGNPIKTDPFPPFPPLPGQKAAAQHDDDDDD